MKRLTDRIKSGPYAGEAVCPTLYIHGTNMEEYDTDVIQALLSRLADYEDAGLEPEEVARLMPEQTCTFAERPHKTENGYTAT